MDRLVAGDRAPGGPKRSEVLTRVDPSLDRAVVLLQDVIQVRHRPVSAIVHQSTLGFEPHDCRRVRAVAVGVDHPRHRIVLPSQRFSQEALCCGRVLLCREKEVDCRTGRVHRPIKVAPLAFDPDVGFVHSPTVVGRSEPRSQSTLNFRGVTLHPPPNGHVVDQKSTLSKEFLHVTVRKREAQLPTHGQENHLRFKLPPLEKTTNRRCQEEHPASLAKCDYKVATLPFGALNVSFISPEKTGD